MVPADTSHADTHACKETQLPDTTRMFPQLWQAAALRTSATKTVQPVCSRVGIFSAYSLCNRSTDLSAVSGPWT